MPSKLGAHSLASRPGSPSSTSALGVSLDPVYSPIRSRHAGRGTARETKGSKHLARAPGQCASVRPEASSSWTRGLRGTRELRALGTPGDPEARRLGGSGARGLGRKEGSAVWPGLRPPPASERDDRPPAPLLASSGRAGAGRSAASAAQGATPPSQIRSTVHWPGVPTPRISTPKKRNRPAARHCATPGDRHIPVSILACSWRPAPNGSDPGVLPRPYTVASLPVSAFPPVWAWRLPSWRPSLQAPSPRPLRSGPDSVRPSSNRFPSPAPAPRRS